MTPIEGIEIKKLERVKTFNLDGKENGWLMDIMRATDEIKKNTKFAQVYVTAASPGAVKGFHWYKKKTNFFCVVKGKVKIVIIDKRASSPTKGKVNEFMVGDENPLLIKIPPYISAAFKNIGKEEALILNCPDRIFDKKDYFSSKEDYEW